MLKAVFWKPLVGWMGGSLRTGDQSSTVETYKYLRSDREDSSWIQTMAMYDKNAHVRARRKKEHTCAHTQTGQKKCKYIQETPAHKCRRDARLRGNFYFKTTCFETIFQRR